MDWDTDWDGRPVYYDRQGAPMTMQQWAQRFEDEDYRHIARDVIGPDEPLDPAPLIIVSTFWLGLNHDWRSGEPLIYETIIVGGEHDASGMWYATERQAREGHRRVVDELRAGRSPRGASPLAPPAHSQITSTAEWQVSRSWVSADRQLFHAEHGRHRRVGSVD
jgi:hypothetical protein